MQIISTHKKNAVIIGLSIKNSYFTDNHLKKIFKYSLEKYESLYFMIPDIPAASTLQALGMSLTKAERKARLESNRLENKINKLINKNPTLIGTKSIRVIRWGHINNNDPYVESLVNLENLYRKKGPFMKEVNLKVESVIKYHETTHKIDEAILIGKDFLLQELAFIISSPQILNEEEVTYLYHKELCVL